MGHYELSKFEICIRDGESSSKQASRVRTVEVDSDALESISMGTSSREKGKFSTCIRIQSYNELDRKSVV